MGMPSYNPTQNATSYPAGNGKSEFLANQQCQQSKQNKFEFEAEQNLVGGWAPAPPDHPRRRGTDVEPMHSKIFWCFVPKFVSSEISGSDRRNGRLDAGLGKNAVKRNSTSPLTPSLSFWLTKCASEVNQTK